MPTPFTAAQRLLETEPHRAWRRLLLLIALTPLVTVPLTFVLTELLSSTGGCNTGGWLGGVIWCPPLPAGLKLLPGLINLAPAWWLLSRDAQTRLAAGVATVLGGLRLGVPLLAMLGTAAHVEGHRGIEVDAGEWAFIPVAFPNDETWAVTGLSAALWIITLVALALVGWAGGRHTAARCGHLHIAARYRADRGRILRRCSRHSGRARFS